MSLANNIKSASLMIGFAIYNTSVLAQQETSVTSDVMAAELGANSPSIFERAWDSGFVIFSVLFILIAFSVLSWAIFITKYLYLKRLNRTRIRSISVSRHRRYPADAA